MACPTLELRNISKNFGSIQALRGVSFSLEAGEVHALLGENGAGKSTLIKVVTGAHAPSGGVISIGGKEYGALSPGLAKEQGIACIYQQPALFADLSVSENLAWATERPAFFRRVRWRERRQRALELLEQVGAHIDPDAELSGLSMPEQQLVEIAKAIGSGAHLLIMDEPTASLTAQEVEKLLALVCTLKNRGVGIIYISHRLEEIFQVADRVTVLRDGKSIGTHKVAEMTESELIHEMVGRPMTTIYPPALAVPGEEVLAVYGLSCKTGGVREVSFTLRAGEILGLAGLVGSGRTELAWTLFGLTPADGGQILLQGRQVRIDSPAAGLRHRIAYVPEDRRKHGVVLPMSIRENVSLAMLRALFPGGWLQRGVERKLGDDAVQRLQVKAESPETTVSMLSGGNQQKVALARWLATRPLVLILDEPTQGVDVGAKAEIHGIIRRLAAEGMAIVLISSDLPEVLGMSDRIAVMRSGTLVATVPAADATAHGLMAIALGEAGEAEAA